MAILPLYRTLGAALLISGMIVSQWNAESRPAAALVPE
jgi:hypothetical protein